MAVAEIEIENFTQIQEDLIEVLKKNDCLTRSQIVAKINRPRTTIYENLTILVQREIIYKFPKQINSKGRPAVFYKICD